MVVEQIAAGQVLRFCLLGMQILPQDLRINCQDSKKDDLGLPSPPSTRGGRMLLSLPRQNHHPIGGTSRVLGAFGVHIWRLARVKPFGATAWVAWVFMSRAGDIRAAARWRLGADNDDHCAWLHAPGLRRVLGLKEADDIAAAQALETVGRTAALAERR
jgi:hypothetical protein